MMGNTSIKLIGQLKPSSKKVELMPIPPHLFAAISRLEIAAAESAFAGAAPPEQRQAIRHQHDKAREALIRAIEKVLNK